MGFYQSVTKIGDCAPWYVGVEEFWLPIWCEHAKSRLRYARTNPKLRKSECVTLRHKGHE